MRKVSRMAALAALCVAPFSIPPSIAHVSLLQKEAAPGAYKAVLAVPHGCDGEPTIAFHVRLPEGFIDAKPMPKSRWELQIEEGDYEHTYRLHGEELSRGPVAVTWSGGSLDDRHYDEFTIHGTLAGVENDQRLFFKAVQTCLSGKEAAWIEEAKHGEDAHALEHPAPFVMVSVEEMAHQDTVNVGELRISSAWARAMLPGQSTAAAYMTIENAGGEPDTLLSASSSSAGKVEIHTMEIKDDVMVMRPLEGGLEVPAEGSVVLEPSGLHIMFLQVEIPFAEGGSVPLTLEFEKAGNVEMELPILPARTGRGHDAYEH